MEEGPALLSEENGLAKDIPSGKAILRRGHSRKGILREGHSGKAILRKGHSNQQRKGDQQISKTGI